jgi:hypothetical protein
MNNALVTLVRKYENKAEATKKFPAVSEFYKKAAQQVLALAMQ